MNSSSILLIVSVVFGAAVLFVAARHFWGKLKRNAEQMQAVIAAVESRFHFKNNSPGGVLPNLYAELNGMKTAVDVLYQSYFRGVNQASGQRPYTRVRVQLEQRPPFEIRVRSQGYQQPPEWPERATGDAAFDLRYQVFAAEEADLAELAPEARKAFVAAKQPVTLQDKFVLWVRPKHVRDPELLIDAVQSCIDVAGELKRSLRSCP